MPAQTLRASVTAAAGGTNNSPNPLLLLNTEGYAPHQCALGWVNPVALPASSPVGTAGAGLVTWQGPAITGLPVYTEGFEVDDGAFEPNAVFGFYTPAASTDPDTTHFEEGTQALKITWAAPGSPVQQAVLGPAIVCDPSTPYVLTARVYSPDTPVGINSVSSGAVNVTVDPEARWQTLTMSIITGSAQTTISPYFSTDAPINGAETWVDSFVLYKQTDTAYSEDFEDGTTGGWGGNSEFGGYDTPISVTAQTGTVDSGTYALDIAWDAAGTPLGQNVVGLAASQLVVGEDYLLTMRVYNDTADSVCPHASFITTGDPIPVLAGWQDVSLTFTVPVGFTNVFVGVTNLSPTVAGPHTFIDNVTLTKVVHDQPVRVDAPTSDLLAGVTYVASTYLYVPTGSPKVAIEVDGTTGGHNVTFDQWERVWVTFTAADAQPAIDLYPVETPEDGAVFYFTGWDIAPGLTLGPFSLGGGQEGDPVNVLVDGSDSAITANGLPGYLPTPGDRLLVQRVGSQVEVLQFLSRGTVPYVVNSDLTDLAAQVNINGDLISGNGVYTQGVNDDLQAYKLTTDDTLTTLQPAYEVLAQLGTTGVDEDYFWVGDDPALSTLKLVQISTFVQGALYAGDGQTLGDLLGLWSKVDIGDIRFTGSAHPPMTTFYDAFVAAGCDALPWNA